MPIEVVRGCANVGGWLELSPYGWNASASMTGRVRPPGSIGLVVAARREPDPDHTHSRVRGLDRVVRDRQELEKCGCGGIAAVRVELGEPEAIQVRLVADDHAAKG